MKNNLFKGKYALCIYDIETETLVYQFDNIIELLNYIYGGRIYTKEETRAAYNTFVRTLGVERKTYIGDTRYLACTVEVI